jgi:hypothetical protein
VFLKPHDRPTQQINQIGRRQGTAALKSTTGAAPVTRGSDEMKINPQHSGTGPVRTRIARGAMMAAILCTGTLTVYSALAQEAADRRP